VPGKGFPRFDALEDPFWSDDFIPREFDTLFGREIRCDYMCYKGFSLEVLVLEPRIVGGGGVLVCRHRRAGGLSVEGPPWEVSCTR
jgi:hypothetical protein